MLQMVRILTLVLMLCGCGASFSFAQSDDLERLLARIQDLQKTKDYAEATDQAEKYVAKVGERYGEGRPEYATALRTLAKVLRQADRLQRAESLLRRA